MFLPRICIGGTLDFTQPLAWWCWRQHVATAQSTFLGKIDKTNCMAGMGKGTFGTAMGRKLAMLAAIEAALSIPADAIALPDGISQTGPDTYKIATGAPVAFPRTLGQITDTEKAAARDAAKFCETQGHQMFVVLFATPTDSSVTFRCMDRVGSVP